MLAVTATAYLVLQQGSISKFAYAVKIGKELSGSYAIMQMAVIAALVSAYGLFTFASEVQDPRGRVRRRIPLPALLFFGALIVINLATNYAWANRYNIALTAFAVGLGWHFYIRRFRLIEIFLVVVLLGALFQTLKYVRLEWMGEVLNQEVDDEHAFWRSLSTSLHFSQFDAFMLALRDAGNLFEFRNGQDFWNGMVSWIPRSLMPDRETFKIGGWFRQVYQPEVINGWPVSVIGSWYINFGVLGIFLGAVISGLVTAAIDRAYYNISNVPWHAIAGPSVAFFMLDGGVNTGFFQQIFLLIVPFSILSIILSLSRAPASSPSRTQQDVTVERRWMS
jgi:hypothetical protein